MSLAQSNYVIQLPKTPSSVGPLDPRAIAQRWITDLEVLLATGNYAQLGRVFHEDSWWRDMLALVWDFRTIQGCAKIQDFLAANQPRAGLSALRLQHEGKFQPRMESPAEGLNWINSIIFFETSVGRGSGVIHLTQNDAGEWKAYAMYTTLQELKEFEEPLGIRRAYGTIETMPGGLNQGNWLERRQRTIEFKEEEPTTLIVGAGTQTSPFVQ